MNGSASNAPGQHPTDTAIWRLPGLIRAASLLLARRVSTHPVRALHDEIRGILGVVAQGSVEAAYASFQGAEQEHRRLVVLASEVHSPPSSRRNFRYWRERLPQWLSWAVVIAVAGGLAGRYSYALFDRARWQRQHPDGNWISRYYTKQKFAGTSLVRYDVGIDYVWGAGAPAQAMARDNWSARWDTCIVATAPAKLRLRLVADDRAQLLLDGVVQLDVKRPGAKKGTVNVAPGVHLMQVEFQEGRRGAKLQLQGLTFAGTSEYRFQRPVLDGDEVRCEAPEAKLLP